MVSLEFFFGHF